jgi:chaperonin cofactor prefoldin
VNIDEETQTATAQVGTATLEETPASETVDAAGSASLEKVRDILFGVQVRDIERRFARLEERLVKETNDLKDGVARRVDALEQRTASLDDQMSTTQREFRQHQVDIHQRLTDDIRQKVDNVLLTLARELQELRTEKADRALIAAIFTEIAKRLTGEVTAPGAEGPGRA